MKHCIGYKPTPSLIALLIAGGALATPALASPEDCGWLFDCPGCFVGVYTKEFTDTLQSEACELGEPTLRGLPFTPTDLLDPVTLDCDETAPGHFSCTAFPQPLDPGDFAYAWVLPHGLQGDDPLYSAWNPVRGLVCTGTGLKSLAVLVVAPSGAAGSAATQVDCGESQSQ